MNIIASLFVGLAVFIFFSGALVNYFTHLVPDSIVWLFRYGRANVSKHGPGSFKKIEVPKRWFWHFYLWAVLLQACMVTTVVKYYLTEDLSMLNNWLSKIVTSATGPSQSYTLSATVTIVAVILFQIHLTRRLFETLFVAVYSGTKMNVGHYMLGFVHYTSAILALVSCSPGFTLGVLSANDFKISFEDLSVEHLIGIVLFLYGNYQQFKAHKAFADLRKGSDKSVATMEHKIPAGGLFEYISCPNYFAEIIIYIGLTFLFGFKNYTWNCCTIWVIANQVTAGIMNHQWYLAKFGEYPKNRKAIIPYIW